MLLRVNEFSSWFELPEAAFSAAQKLAEQVAARAEGMTHLKDYQALGASLVAQQPARIFEIGTYLGLTANFFLDVLPDSTVVSIAYVNPPRLLGGRRFNNSELKKSEVGAAVTRANQSRFHQHYGDSHQLSATELIAQYGRFDFVFIDGDHSLEGVKQDTQLALALLSPGGMICWHDANPKDRYLDVRHFLETMPRHALATADTYIGGVACWSEQVERRIRDHAQR